ncbi:hypothetical protein PMI22_05577, partial [Pseudomonas sp. GM21]
MLDLWRFSGDLQETRQLERRRRGSRR